MSKRKVKARLEEVTLSRIDLLNDPEREDTAYVIKDVVELSQAINDIEKTSNGKKEKWVKFGEGVLCSLITVGGYLFLNHVALKYEDEDRTFRYTSTKSNLNKASYRK